MLPCGWGLLLGPPGALLGGPHPGVGLSKAHPACRSLPCSVRVRNVYFEDTPLELLAGVVTETGPLDRGGIDRALASRRQKYRTAFQLA